MSSFYGDIQNRTNNGILSNKNANNFIVGFLSGSLVSVIHDNTTNSKTDLKEVIKISTQSGIAASTLSDAKDKFECGRYFEGALSLAIGAGGVYLIEKVANSKKAGEEHE